MPKKPERHYFRHPDAKLFKFSANPALSDEIITLSKERFRSMSSTIRMLLWIGIEQYKINKLSGTTTQQKRQQDTSVKQAQAQAAAAERERKKLGKDTGAGAVTPLLYGVDTDPE